jgi:hypothetical protein
MAASKQIGIKEVLNLQVFNYTTGANVFYADYASNTSIEHAAERLDLRGGQGNYKLLSFDHTKNAMMKCELPLVDLEFIALLTGKALNTGAVAVPKREVLTSSGATPTITLAATPIAGTLKIYALSGNRDVGTEQTAGTPSSTQNAYSISGAVVTLNATSGVAGSQFIVTYNYTSAATVRTSIFTADKFPGYFRITGEGLVTDQVDGNTYTVKFDLKKCKPQNNFTVSMSGTEATKLNITFDLYAVDVSDGSGGIDKVYYTMSEMV